VALIAALNELAYPFTEPELAGIPSVHGLVASLIANDRPLLLIATSSRRASELADEVRSYLGPDAVLEFAPWETLPHERLSPKADTVASRFATLHELGSSTRSARIVVTSVRGLLQPLSPDLLDVQLPNLEVGTEIGLPALAEQLSYLGFSRVDLVERRGDFAVRGGIVDLFPADSEHPVRIDFFGDEI